MTFDNSARGGSGGRRGRLAGAARLGAAVIASGALATAAVAAAGPAGAAAHRTAAAHRATRYLFHTVRNHRDVTFNQLLGINSRGKIAGYFGSGAKGHPNRGYVVLPPYRQADFRRENFPHSKQTQVTGLNNRGVTVGFWSKTNKASQVNDNIGFWARNHHFHSVRFPTRNNSTPRVNQLLGVNDHKIAVGFYVNKAGNSRAYEFNIRTGRFTRAHVPGSTSTVASAINNKGSVAGFFTDSHGVTRGFFLRHTGRLFILTAPGASMTTPFGVSKSGEVVGAFATSGGASHGFTWTRQHGFRTVDDPHGIGTTTINGVNKFGVLVGFYTDAAGNTDGMIAVPRP